MVWNVVDVNKNVEHSSEAQAKHGQRKVFEEHTIRLSQALKLTLNRPVQEEQLGARQPLDVRQTLSPEEIDSHRANASQGGSCPTPPAILQPLSETPSRLHLVEVHVGPRQVVRRTAVELCAIRTTYDGNRSAAVVVADEIALAAWHDPAPSAVIIA